MESAIRPQAEDEFEFSEPEEEPIAAVVEPKVEDAGNGAVSKGKASGGAQTDALRKLDMADLERMRLQELRELARDYRVTGYSGMKKDDLILLLLRAKAEHEGFSFGGGILEITDDSMGFLAFGALCTGSGRCLRVTEPDPAIWPA